jgi:histidyl-tRNA synthetase
VWRGENTQRGRYREFFQCDFDIVGSDSAASDFEVLLLIKASMEALGVEKFTIRLSHRGIFNRFLDRLDLRDRSAEILRTVDKLRKVGAEEVARLLSEAAGREKSEKILSYIKGKGDFQSTLQVMEAASGGESGESRRLRTIYSFMKETGTEGRIVLDPSITRGLDYYTGIVYETFLDEMAEIGSVCSGGRYDDLASLYSKEKIPGVGASVGLDRLLAAMEALGKKGCKSESTRLIVFSLDESLSGYYQGLAQSFRSAGIEAEVFLEMRKLPQQYAYAEKKSIGWGVLCGAEDRAKGTFTLRNLATRENRDGISVQEALSLILADS